jgi:hypothetical protein
MKVLQDDKVVEDFTFPVIEALNFSVLVWIVWGFAEAFFWEHVLPFAVPTAEKLDPWIYIASFFVYISIAIVLGLAAYMMVSLTLFSSGKSESTALFRGATMASILGFFFLLVLGYHLPSSVWQSTFSRRIQYAIIGGSIVFAMAGTVYLFRKASQVGFRLRRSGAMMFSILALSAVFSFVRFPLFSDGARPDHAKGLRQAMTKLTAYHYVSALLPEDQASDRK